MKPSSKHSARYLFRYLLLDCYFLIQRVDEEKKARVNKQSNSTSLGAL